MTTIHGFVSDADAMIDFIKAAPGFVRLVGQHLGPLHLPIGVLGEIDELNEEICQELEIRIYEPTLDELNAASILQRPRSPHDRTCLQLGIQRAWTVITNDKQLRLCCNEFGVPTIRGLGLIKLLIHKDVLSRAEGIIHAEAIHKVNPKYITAMIVDEFRQSIK